jgi:hypothetical protein
MFDLELNTLRNQFLDENKEESFIKTIPIQNKLNNI